MVWESGAQKLSRHQYIHSVNPFHPTVSRKVRELMSVPGNKIFRSVGLEEFCGFRFLARSTRVGLRRYMVEDKPLISSLPSKATPAIKPHRLLLFRTMIRNGRYD